MAKSALRLQARELRSKGESVKTIAKKLGISKSSVSLWVRDIILTVKQLENLRQSEIKGAELGRLRNSLLQKQKRMDLVKSSQEKGKETIGILTNREALMAGLALYWGEGSKKNRRIELCNSDPKMIKFFLQWLNQCFSIQIVDIKCYVGINEAHKDREEVVKKYWSNVTGIPLGQFTKTSFKKVQSKKVYTNANEHFGTLSVKVLKPAKYYYTILGLIEGLANSLPG